MENSQKRVQRPLKVCITASMLPDCGRGAFNGCVQHTLFMGRWFKRRLGAQVGYIIPKDSNRSSVTPAEMKLAGGTFFTEQREILEYDIVFAVGQHVSTFIKRRTRELGIPLVIIRLGNDLVYDTTHVLAASKFSRPNGKDVHMGSIVQGGGYQECWISPHFAYSIDYYAYVSELPLGSTRIVPYFWDPVFIERQFQKRKEKLMPLTPGNVHIAVFESNQTMNKSMFMPLIALHYGDAYFKNAHFMCCNSLKKKTYVMHKTFYSFVGKCKGVLDGRVTFNGRLPLLDIMGSNANVVLSWQRDWSLNYLTLECLWLGIPIIHNCAEMKQFGFYYHENDMAGAIAHMKRLNEKPFDRDAYRKKSRRIMTIFGPDKPELLAFIRERVRSLVKNTATPGFPRGRRIKANIVDDHPSPSNEPHIMIDFKEPVNQTKMKMDHASAFM